MKQERLRTHKIIAYLAVVVLVLGVTFGFSEKLRDNGPKPQRPVQASASQDADGWTVLTPSADTRFVYVSTAGNDAAAGTESAPIRTLTEAYARVRDGYPDWILLCRGEVWNAFPQWFKSGRSADEPMVITSYGQGARPRIDALQGTRAFRMENWDPNAYLGHVAIIGLHFRGHVEDPLQFSGYGVFLGAKVDDVLLEDCAFTSFADTDVNVYGSPPPLTTSNIRLRRNLIADSYSLKFDGGTTTEGHSQGLFAGKVKNLLLEENVFDHNGWNAEIPEAYATMFNHSIYPTDCEGLIVRGNIFARCASMHCRVNTHDGISKDMVVENNVFIEGEIGVSLSADSPGIGLHQNATIRNNVFMHLDRNTPTHRKLGWGVDLLYTKGVSVTNNIFLPEGASSDPSSPWEGYGVHMSGTGDSEISIERNVFYSVRPNAIYAENPGTPPNWSGIKIASNQFQNPKQDSAAYLFEGTYPSGVFSFSRNVYFTDPAALARVNGTNQTYAQWTALSKETGSEVRQIAHPDPNRDVESYHQSLGGEATLDAFMREARLQSRDNWRPAYTAAALNNYIRAGFRLATPHPARPLPSRPPYRSPR